MSIRSVGLLAPLVTVVALAGCGSPKPSTPEKKTGDAHDHDHDHDHGHTHEHKAPHNGALVVLGDEFAHVEIVLDPADGKLTAYVLDGEAEKSVRVKQAELELKIALPGEPLTLALKAVASSLTGETVGDTSEFSAQSDKLKDVKSFDAEVVAITARGQAFNAVKFNFPKGNEEKH